MTNHNSSRMMLIIAAALAAMLVKGGTDAYRLLNSKAEAQTAVTDTVHRWKQSIHALENSMRAWSVHYPAESALPDLYSLYQGLQLDRYGLQSNPDQLTVGKSNEEVTRNGTPLGLTRVCLRSGGTDGGGFLVAAADYSSLFHGLRQLAKRPDIEIASIAVQGDHPTPLAKLDGFCILVRKG